MTQLAALISGEPVATAPAMLRLIVAGPVFANAGGRTKTGVTGL